MDTRASFLEAAFVTDVWDIPNKGECSRSSEKDGD
jgi:hypothetical protein